MTNDELAELKAGIQKSMNTVPDKVKSQKLVTVKAVQVLDLIARVEGKPAK